VTDKLTPDESRIEKAQQLRERIINEMIEDESYKNLEVKKVFMATLNDLTVTANRNQRVQAEKQKLESDNDTRLLIAEHLKGIKVRPPTGGNNMSVPEHLPAITLVPGETELGSIAIDLEAMLLKRS
jgi:hypothetical protein